MLGGGLGGTMVGRVFWPRSRRIVLGSWAVWLEWKWYDPADELGWPAAVVLELAWSAVPVVVDVYSPLLAVSVCW